MDENVLLTIGWQPIIHFNKDAKVAVLKVWYKLLDEENPDNIDDITPIQLIEEEKKQEENE